MTATSWTADRILDLPQYSAVELFGPEPDQAFRALARLWHPDVCADPRAQDVFSWISALRTSLKNDSTVRMIRGGAGDERLVVVPVVQAGAGRRWVGPGVFGLSYENDADLAAVFVRNVRAFPFASTNMRKEMQKVLPCGVRTVHLKEKTGEIPMLLVERKGDAVLSDWIAAHGAIPAAHLAWIGSGLLNIGAWAGWSKWTIPNINLDTIAIDPETHNVRVVAGWEEAAAAGQRPVCASSRTLKLCPLLATRGYSPPPTFTREVIRQALREAAGDPSGLGLVAQGVPRSMAEWIQSPPARKATDDYRAWYGALERAFGKRRFVKWGKTAEAVYARRP